MQTITLYRRGTEVLLNPAPETEPILLTLAAGVLIDPSRHGGAVRLYRLAGTVGLDLQTALDAGWCRIVSCGGSLLLHGQVSVAASDRSGEEMGTG
jgi:hypothetical protein